MTAHDHREYVEAWVGAGPGTICPECRQPVTRDDPAWIEDGRQLHHDPCPEAKP